MLLGRLGFVFAEVIYCSIVSKRRSVKTREFRLTKWGKIPQAGTRWCRRFSRGGPTGWTTMEEVVVVAPPWLLLQCEDGFTEVSARPYVSEI